MSPPNRASTGQPRRDWRSGYKPIDELIQEIRLEFPYPSHNLNWIPYDEFVGSRLITQGGFSSIFEAMWNKSGQTVALKCLKDSQDLSSDYLNEIKTHWGLFSQPQFLRCYGITQYPITGEFMIVLQYASFGDLRLHLQRNRVSSWKDKIRILKQIARGLAEMHKKDLTHGNLHSGNIMNIDKSHFVIGDVGLCGPANRNIRKKAVYGVLPYVAPELFRGIGSSKKVDIYSFGIIMWEICSGMRPYAGTAHDINMAKDICKGKRPPVPPGTPSFYSELMKKCWHHNPNERPDAPEVLKTVYHWLVNDSLDEFLRKGGSTISFNNVSNDRTHPDAIYCSRLLDFPELREERRRQILAHSRADLKNNSNNNSNRSSIDQNNLLKPPQIYKPLLSKSSEDTLRSRTSQKTDNTSKQSFNTSIPRPSQRINNYSKTPQERYNNNSSQDSYNYSKSSQTSYYGHTKPSQNILENHNSKSLQHSPIIPTQTTRPEMFGKSELSINPKGPVSGLSVFIPDDDVETLTSFWSMEGPKPNDKNLANNFRL